jgi:alcohol dehydrogenase class IV
VAATGIPERVRAQLLAAGIKAEVCDGVHVEPTDESFRQVVEFARGSEWDGFVAIGGGSSITAKAVDLMTTYPADVMRAAGLLGADPAGAGAAGRRELLPATLVDLMRDVGIPSGLAALGYGEEDVPGLVEGALRQQRLLAVAPRPGSGDDIAEILRASMANW